MLAILTIVFWGCSDLENYYTSPHLAEIEGIDNNEDIVLDVINTSKGISINYYKGIAKKPNWVDIKEKRVREDIMNITLSLHDSETNDSLFGLVSILVDDREIPISVRQQPIEDWLDRVEPHTQNNILGSGSTDVRKVSVTPHNKNVEWTCKPDSGWCIIQQTGNEAIITCRENKTRDTRSTTITFFPSEYSTDTIRHKKVVINQSPYFYINDVKNPAVTLSKQNPGPKYFQIESNVKWQILLDDEAQNWIEIQDIKLDNGKFAQLSGDDIKGEGSGRIYVQLKPSRWPPGETDMTITIKCIEDGLEVNDINAIIRYR